MGKSSSSCLKIIACGSDTAADNDELDSSEAKASGNKGGWSFRKKSGRHRVLGNNVGSETTTFADKEIPQVCTTDLHASVKSTADEKPQLPKPVEKISDVISALEFDSESKTSGVVVASEKDCSATYVESKASQVVVASENDSDATSTESKMDNTVVLSVTDNDKPSSESIIPSELADSIAEINESLEPEVSDSLVASENVGDTNVVMDETVAVIIQTAIRGFLAERDYLQLKSATKLQAVIRGHLVRRNAVETLHCIRGIAKVQALVRARSSKSLDQKYTPSDTQFSTVKLLKNGFARQLLESTPKSKSMNIRCDPLSPNSAWGWLERWMSVSSSEVAQTGEPNVETQNDNQDQEIHSRTETELSSVAPSDTEASVFSTKPGDESQDIEDNQFIHDVKTVDFHLSLPLSMESNTQQSNSQSVEIINEDAASVEKDSLASEYSDSLAEPISPAERAAEIQQPKPSTKRSASEELNEEGRKLLYGSRKASNPAFIAAQSKFEELTSVANPARSVSSSHEDIEAESHVDTGSFPEESGMETNEPRVEVPIPSDPHIHVADSESGTELSISSTLDSPDRSELENVRTEQEIKVLEASYDPDSIGGQDVETNGISSTRMSDIPSVLVQQEEVHKINDDGVPVSPVVTENSPQEEQKPEMNPLVEETPDMNARMDNKTKMNSQEEQKSEIDISDLQANVAPVSSMMDADSSQMEVKHEFDGHDGHIEHVSSTGHRTYSSSPEASPQSHMTIPESQGTPSSQVSVKGKRSKIDKSGSSTKRESLSAGKKSPSNRNLDLGARSSTEHLPKDQKSGKRRNSFGSAKSDNTDQEPRDSSSHISLPSYMQATKSAKAKAHSPRSSPDVHDKEGYSKKRHSLPGAGGRQGSPRIQRSTSQVEEGAKANGSHPSNERKWQR